MAPAPTPDSSGRPNPPPKMCRQEVVSSTTERSFRRRLERERRAPARAGGAPSIRSGPPSLTRGTGGRGGSRAAQGEGGKKYGLKLAPVRRRCSGRRSESGGQRAARRSKERRDRPARAGLHKPGVGKQTQPRRRARPGRSLLLRRGQRRSNGGAGVSRQGRTWGEPAGWRAPPLFVPPGPFERAGGTRRPPSGVLPALPQRPRSRGSPFLLPLRPS